MRMVWVLALLALAGCGSSGDSRQGQAPAAVAEPGFECATDGASDYDASCTIERAAARSGTVLTLRGPTGSFRRLRVANGKIEAADGAEPARILSEDARRVEVAIGGDRYRIPRGELR